MHRVLLLAGILALPAVSAAQNQPAGGANPPEQDVWKAIAELRNEVNELKRQLDEVGGKAVDERFKAAVGALQDQINTVSHKVDAVTRRDQRDNTIPSVLSNMDRSPEFRDEMAQAVQRVLPPQRGKLRVRNTSTVDANLRVNGQSWRIPAGSNVQIDVPTGPVTTELLGLEPAKSWTIGPPNYEFVLDITPAAPAVQNVPRPIY
jgi:hypothetical protein